MFCKQTKVFLHILWYWRHQMICEHNFSIPLPEIENQIQSSLSKPKSHFLSDLLLQSKCCLKSSISCRWTHLQLSQRPDEHQRFYRSPLPHPRFWFQSQNPGSRRNSGDPLRSSQVGILACKARLWSNHFHICWLYFLLRPSPMLNTERQRIPQKSKSYSAWGCRTGTTVSPINFQCISYSLIKWCHMINIERVMKLNGGVGSILLLAK